VCAAFDAAAKQQGDLIPVRLVNGAYWDTEIKLCQPSGLDVTRYLSHARRQPDVLPAALAICSVPLNRSPDLLARSPP